MLPQASTIAQLHGKTYRKRVISGDFLRQSVTEMPIIGHLDHIPDSHKETFKKLADIQSQNADKYTKVAKDPTSHEHALNTHFEAAKAHSLLGNKEQAEYHLSWVTHHAREMLGLDHPVEVHYYPKGAPKGTQEAIGPTQPDTTKANTHHTLGSACYIKGQAALDKGNHQEAAKHFKDSALNFSRALLFHGHGLK